MTGKKVNTTSVSGKEHSAEYHQMRLKRYFHRLMEKLFPCMIVPVKIFLH